MTLVTYLLNDPRAARRLNWDAAVIVEVVIVLLVLWPIDVRMVMREKSTDLVFLIVESGDLGVCWLIWLSHSICFPFELTRNILWLWQQRWSNWKAMWRASLDENKELWESSNREIQAAIGVKSKCQWNSYARLREYRSEKVKGHKTKARKARMTYFSTRHRSFVKQNKAKWLLMGPKSGASPDFLLPFGFSQGISLCRLFDGDD